MIESQPPCAAPTELRSLYIDLLKRAIINWIYGPNEREHYSLWKRLQLLFHGVNPWVAKPMRFHQDDRLQGRDWPPYAHSMIGWQRLSHLQFCVESVLHDNVAGDFIEAGVWRGGACILMRGILQAYRVTDRRVFVLDSFRGLPSSQVPEDRRLRLNRVKDLAINRTTVEENFRRYGLLDSQVQFVEGFFSDTLPTFKLEKIAVLRIDADMYQSTTEVLTALYPRLSPGGYIIVDDYGCITSCRRAVEHYRSSEGIQEPLQLVDWSAVYWRKTLPTS